MSELIVDTYSLKEYAQRIDKANSRIVGLDWKMKSLYTKVGLLDLFKLVQADCLTCCSWRLVRCSGYLRSTAEDLERVEKKLSDQDPTNFSKPPISGFAEVIYDVGVAVVKQAEAVQKFTEELITGALESYYSHGTVYKVFQVGKAVLKFAKGVKKIALGVGALFGTGGVSAPVAILLIISGANDVYNSTSDLTYAALGEFEEMGKTNYLKELLEENGSELGRLIGNEELGKTVGDVVYFGVDLVSTLAMLDQSLDKIKQLSSTDFGKFGSELKEIGNLDISKYFTMDFETLRYEIKLASYTFSETTNFITNVGALYDVGEKAVAFGKNLNNFFTIHNPEAAENPVIDFFDNVSDIEDKIGKGIKWSIKVTKFLFD